MQPGKLVCSSIPRTERRIFTKTYRTTIELVDVAGIEPATSCLLSEPVPGRVYLPLSTTIFHGAAGKLTGVESML